jgi:hypothetical protein
MRGKRADSVQLCDDNCKYRRLYEGSQRSLTEMAGRQAQAVSRVGRLRNQLVLAAKRAFPRAFGEAERALGKRMSEVTDEILVAYLESFMGTSILAEEPEGVADLRQALNEIGVFVPGGTDLREWAEAIRRHGLQKTDSTPVIAVAAPEAVKPQLLRNRDLLAPKPQPEVLDLDDLFEPVEVDATVTLDMAQSETIDLPKVDIGVIVHPLDTEDDVFGVDMFAEDLIPGSRNAGEGTGGESPMGDAFGEPIFGGANFGDGGVGGEIFGETFTDGAAESPDGGLEVTDSDRNHVMDPSKEIVKVETVAEAQPLPAWATGKTVKPQLFPSGSGGATKPAKRVRKQVKTRATAPDVPDAGMPNEPADGQISDKVREQLMASIAVPRPVFTSDLAAVVGSEDLVSTWRDELQTGDLTVRFVLPKPRHRARGSLVIPQPALAGADSGFSRSHWARCMESYRGARIYELGVFFHRFVEQVISFESDGEVVAVRMSLQNGLTGAVMVAGQDLAEGGATRVRIVETLERFLQDRLVHVAILVLNAEQFEAVRAAVVEEATARNWVAAMPVTLSRSWEYVEGTGTAIPVLGV